MVSTSIPAPASLQEALALVGELLAEKRRLELRVQALEKRLFGPRSEKLHLEDHQIPLLEGVFKNPVPAATTDVVVPEAPAGQPSEKTARRKPVRRPLPEHLEVVEERLEPASKSCGRCGREQCLVREECTERLDLIPAKLIRRRTVRPVYACGSCKEQPPVQVPMPPQVIEKGLCGPGLLSHVILSKYLDHRPLYRVQQELGRHGVEVTRSTLSDWVNAVAAALEPLQQRLRQDLVGGDYLQLDETPVKVIDPDLLGRTATGWLWVYARPGGPVLFDFQGGRGREGPERMLRDFRGTFQSDGYGVYESIERQRPDLRRVGCWAHARRKFHEALEDDAARAREFIVWIARLYAVEKEAREQGLTPEARKALRGERVPEVLARLRGRLEELEPGKPTSAVLLKSPLGMAIRYTLGQWDALVRYLEDGRFDIDNNLVENAIRPTAVGKKNWLFIGHPEAGWRSAVIYSLLITARRAGLDPAKWLEDVLRRIPTATTANLHELLPANWKPATA